MLVWQTTGASQPDGVKGECLRFREMAWLLVTVMLGYDARGVAEVKWWKNVVGAKDVKMRTTRRPKHWMNHRCVC